jgi:hypothetical protein
VGASHNWTNTWATATVRDAEGLVQVQVGNVSTKLTKLCKPNHCVGVRSINVNLAAARVN